MEVEFVTVILPLALPKLYTYSVPEDMKSMIKPGMRVEVPLKNKLYSAIVYKTHGNIELPYRTRPIVSVIDDYPLVTKSQLQFWTWISEYYCCTLGEVMNVALPSGLKLESETKVFFNEDPELIDSLSLSDDEYLIVEAIMIQQELTILQIQDILNKKSVFPILRRLFEKGIVAIKEELKEKFKPKTVNFITLCEPYLTNPSLLTEAFEKVAKSEKQTKLLLAFVQLSKNKHFSFPVSEVSNLAEVETSIVQALVKKGIFIRDKQVISRIYPKELDEDQVIQPLSHLQEEALGQIEVYFEEKKPVLLHGITGSGKTRIYTELITKAIDSSMQTLFLLPEIALTSHMVERLKKTLGNDVLVYHSRLSNNERVEIWNAVLMNSKIIIGARSSLFLPFTNLGLIIVDEEHDPSYKQNDPNPRYNARDAAIYLANRTNAQIILGSATPSLESYDNVMNKKYGLVEIHERHGASILPKMHVVNLKEEYKDKTFKGIFSSKLLTDIENVLTQKEQVLLFQNRRGYVPVIECSLCGWVAECVNCDVRMTKHKILNELRCHYCGTSSKLPDSCPACGHASLNELGLGTEKIEEELKALFPSASIARLDYDTARTKTALETILLEFELRKIDILIGTQMITKGLDFDNISLVGVLNADSLLKYPDLRANERAFQLLTQVSGRAGRRQKQGNVIIQTYNPTHPIIIETMNLLYDRFFKRESDERKMYKYPPYYRMIQIEFFHKNSETVADAAKEFATLMKSKLGERVLGPAIPPIARIRGQYVNTITIKLEKNHQLASQVKILLQQTTDYIKNIQALKYVRINIDVDPY